MLDVTCPLFGDTGAGLMVVDLAVDALDPFHRSLLSHIVLLVAMPTSILVVGVLGEGCTVVLMSLVVLLLPSLECLSSLLKHLNPL